MEKAYGRIGAMTEHKKKIADEIMDRNGARNEAMLIGILQEIQREERYLPREMLEYVSERMDIPLTRIYTIATFYKSFSLTPRGEHQMKVCTGTACHIKGAGQTCEEIRRRLGIDEGETTPDMQFSLEKVNCLGTCALAPVIVVDNDYYDGVNPAKIRRILKSYSRADEN
ncbi:NAD(P)H-dependent oxidoreductase subunit E [Thermodesulfobacteriota bacterium]